MVRRFLTNFQKLQRQFDSALYESLALSRDKDKVMELARKGQVIEKPEDVLKDPYILEFTGLEEFDIFTSDKYSLPKEVELDKIVSRHLKKE